MFVWYTVAVGDGLMVTVSVVVAVTVAVSVKV